jgi:outer membrane protein assembly factor BamB
MKQAPASLAIPATAPPYRLAWARGLESSPEVLLGLTPDLVVIADAQRGIHARAAANGTERWSARELTGVTAMLVTAEHLVALAEGQAVALDPGTGSVRWRASAGAGSRWIASAGSTLLVNGGSELAALAGSDGKVLWRSTFEAPARTRATVDGTRAVVALDNHAIVAVDLRTGAPEWRIMLDEPAHAVVASRGRVYVTLSRYTCCAFTLASGERDWCMQTAIPAAGDPVVDDAFVHVAMFDGLLRTFDRRSGVLRRFRSLEGRPAVTMGVLRAGPRLAVPLLSGEVVFVTAADGTLTRLPIPVGVPSQVMQHAASTPDGGLFATAAVTPDGTRLLSVYWLIPASVARQP